MLLLHRCRRVSLCTRPLRRVGAARRVVGLTVGAERATVAEEVFLDCRSEHLAGNEVGAAMVGAAVPALARAWAEWWATVGAMRSVRRAAS